MVKNHSKKNDARNMIANTGQNLTSALTAVSGVAKPSYLSTLTYPKGATPSTFITSLDEYLGYDTVRQSAYDSTYASYNGDGYGFLDVVKEFSSAFDDLSDKSIMALVPTSAQLVEHYGTWTDACNHAGIKTFNGYIVSHTLDKQKFIIGDVVQEPTGRFLGTFEGIQDYPNWLPTVGYTIANANSSGVADFGSDETFYFNYELFSDEANALRLGTDDVKPNGILAATELAFLYADMATAIREGKSPDKAVLKQWQSNAEQFMGKGAMPSDDQLYILESAKVYLEL